MDCGDSVRGQHGAAKRERESEDGVLPLDHLERGNQVLQQRHARIVKEKAGPSGPAVAANVVISSPARRQQSCRPR